MPQLSNAERGNDRAGQRAVRSSENVRIAMHTESLKFMPISGRRMQRLRGSGVPISN
jgi:hypothetical protein